MLNYFSSAAPYFLTGLIVYLIFRAIIWLLYYRGEMRVPIWHEAGFFILVFSLLVLFSSTVSPALGFSLKPSFKGANFIPIKGIIDMTINMGFSSVLGAVLKYVPLGFLFPFLFRRFQNFVKVILLNGGIALLAEIFQLFLTGADTNIDEVLLALLGTFLGYFLFGMVRMYLPEVERMGTVKRSRRKGVPFAVKKELELFVILILLAVVGKGTQLEAARVKAEKIAQEELEKKQAEERKAAEEAEAQRLAEEEAKKLKIAEEMPDLTLEAGSACLFSVDDDMILYEKNGTERVQPASTAKLLTALTVLKYCGVDEVMTAGEEINLISQGSSTASLKVGTRGSVKTFLCALLLPSGNDAAYALANYTGHKIMENNGASTADAIETFVKAMNSLAAELELEDSNFESPDGDQADNQYTTARDMIRVAKACLENETIMELAGKASSRALFENMDVTYKNTNQLLQTSSENYYEGTIGLKTGSINEVKCLIGAIEINGRRYLTAVMQDTEEGRWKDTKILFDEAAGE